MPHTIDDKLLTKRLFQDIQRHNPRHFRTPHNVEEGENAVKRLIPNSLSLTLWVLPLTP